MARPFETAEMSPQKEGEKVGQAARRVCMLWEIDALLPESEGDHGLG